MNIRKPSGKHLDLSRRQVIYNCLVNIITNSEIASSITLDSTSVFRKVKKENLKKEIKAMLLFVMYLISFKNN